MPYPRGVPNPLVARAHPYPTRYHGTCSKRPVFGFPFVPGVHNVLLPSELEGLGQGVDTKDGIFRRPELDGGGIFNRISGLGAIDSSSVVTLLLGAAAGFIGVTVYLRKKGQ